jgi:hypothetical protein
MLLLKVADAVATRHPEYDFHPAEMVGEDDVRTLRGRGFRAIGIAGRDPQTGILPHWHRPDDMPVFVSEETMECAADILHAMLKEIDQKLEDLKKSACSKAKKSRRSPRDRSEERNLPLILPLRRCWVPRMPRLSWWSSAIFNAHIAIGWRNSWKICKKRIPSRLQSIIKTSWFMKERSWSTSGNGRGGSGEILALS